MNFDIKKLIGTAIERSASDIHISPSNPPILRVNGQLERMQVSELDNNSSWNLIGSLMNENQQNKYKANLEIDFATTFNEEYRCRVNAFFAYSGCAAVIRLIPNKIKSAQELNIPDVIRNLRDMHQGLALITGPTGSGKSTTMASIINEMNCKRNAHIITVEDPIEFIHKSNKSLINHREVGLHTKSFKNALRSALREDPDVIFVGEMRDLETIQLALTAAETGHAVFGTLHTNSAISTIDRIVDVFPAEEKSMVRSMLANSLSTVVSQTLLKKKDGSGMVAAHEILVATSAARNLIREGKLLQIQSLMQTGSNLGMCLMKDKLFQMEKDGVISSEELKRVSSSDNAQQKSSKQEVSEIIDDSSDEESFGSDSF